MRRILSMLLCLAMTLALGCVGTAPAFAESPSGAAPTFSDLTAVMADGRLYRWGSALGLGEDHPDPVELGTGYVATGQFWGVKEDHSLWMWGFKDIVEGVTSYMSGDFDPEARKIMDNVLYASMGSHMDLSTVVVLKTDGTAWGWGLRSVLFGEQSYELIPPAVMPAAPVKLLDNVKQVACNGSVWMAVKNDGTLWGAGKDYHSLVTTVPNDGTVYCSLRKIMDDVSAVSLDEDNVLVIKTDGSLWSWGHNSDGQVGNGSATGYGTTWPTPAKILDDVVWADAGDPAFAITSNGTLYGWGVNEYHELGITGGNGSGNLGVCQTTPTVITQNVAATFAGGSSAVIPKTDGSLWAAESNPLNDEKLATWTKFMDNVKLPKISAASGSGAGSNPGINTGTTFTDVPAAFWAAKDISKAAELGLVTGTGDGLFTPNREMTYAEFLAMVTRAFWADEVKAQGTSGEWYTPNLNVANAHSLLSGTRLGSSMALPTDQLNRYEMAVIIANVRAQKGGAPGASAVESAKQKIGDWSSIPGAYQQAVAVSFASGLITGTDISGTFNGNGTMTRAQAATVLVRMVG